jgi:hypothetical protein
MGKDFKYIRITLWAMIAINSLFLWSEFMDGLLPISAAFIAGEIESVRTPLMIIEFLAIATLFVDLVVRYDRIKERLQTLHVLAVGFCVTSFTFQLFVYYMDSAFLK